LHASTRESALLCRSRVVHVMICGGKTFFFAPFLNVLSFLFTIPPRQELSITIGLAIRTRGVTRARIRNRIRNRIRIRVLICTRMDFCFITTTKRDKTTNKSVMCKIYYE
jgi:RNase P protein component